MMTAAHLAVLSEGLALAEKNGFDLGQIAPLILNGPSGSPVVQMKMPRLIERRYDDTDFSLRWMLKDVRYALALADSGLHDNRSDCRGYPRPASRAERSGFPRWPSAAN
jgi:3-hydroxyisobutyrate dehydrogenase-like beta-hydroxyacid dehydrogenase